MVWVGFDQICMGEQLGINYFLWFRELGWPLYGNPMETIGVGSFIDVSIERFQENIPMGFQEDPRCHPMEANGSQCFWRLAHPLCKNMETYCFPFVLSCCTLCKQKFQWNFICHTRTLIQFFNYFSKHIFFVIEPFAPCRFTKKIPEANPFAFQ